MLFEGQVSRKPNLYPWTQEIINALWTSHWTPNEFNFRSDLNQFYNDLTKEEQGVITRTLSAIGQIEIAVKRFWTDLGIHFPHPSMSDMGIVMGNNEVIHNQAYEKLLEVLHLQSAFDEALKEPVIEGRVQYLRKYNDRAFVDDRKQYIYAIMLFSLFVENTSLFGQFYVILNFNRFKAVLKDTAQQVAYTKHEEDLHAQAGILLIETLRREYPKYFDTELQLRVEQECKESLEHEFKIIDWILQGYESENLSAPILKAYVNKRLSDAMVKCGYSPIPLSDAQKQLLEEHTLWMEEDVNGGTLTDFFQKRPIDYAKNNRSFNEEELF